ncbi:SPOR domain-containing protein [Salipaludibacillus daqingensis]|uniref:SPOR domain-containing protein n=1 Tax=Salipaludibacillus daqingensis TaxID=3041001 RepID=UPI002476B8FA|nr:hypothetical protein [Salipaludibacillus daqingensis]
MKKENDVLVRIDGKYQKVERGLKTDEIAASQAFKEDEEPLNNDKQKIVDFNKRRRAMEETRAPFWDDGIREHSPKLPPSNRKKKKPSLDKFSLQFFKNKVFLSCVAAILVGGAFGMMLLSLFTGQEATSSQNQAGFSDGPSIVDVATDIDTEENTRLTIPSLELHFVQVGAFSTIEKGNEVASLLKSEGLPATLLEDGDIHYLFTGMAMDRKGADILANYIEEEGQETYVKSFAVSTDNLELEEDFHTFLTKGREWIEYTSIMAINDIRGTSPSNEQVKNLIDIGQAWEDSYEELSFSNEEVEGLSKEWVEENKEIIDEYSSDSSSSGIGLETQESLMNGMLIYKDLIQALKNT